MADVDKPVAVTPTPCAMWPTLKSACPACLLESAKNDFRVARHSSGTRTPIPNVRADSPLDLLSSSSLHFPGGLFNESCHSSRLRDVDGVAALDLNDRGARPLGHGTLGVRWDHPVIGGDQVPARLGPPRRFANCATESRHAPRSLRIGPERCLFCVHVGGERGGELCLVLEQIAVLRRQYRRGDGSPGAKKVLNAAAVS